MDDGMRVLLGRRKNRTLAIMLAEKDDMVETGRLDEDAGEDLRKVILDQVNDFHDFCVDWLEASDYGMVTNQLALDRLVEILKATPADT